jgi:hypothetical protein
MNELVKLALGMTGLSQTAISDIENALPAMTRLLSDQNKSDLNIVIPVIKNLLIFIQSKKTV